MRDVSLFEVERQGASGVLANPDGVGVMEILEMLLKVALPAEAYDNPFHETHSTLDSFPRGGCGDDGSDREVRLCHRRVRCLDVPRSTRGRGR